MILENFLKAIAPKYNSSLIGSLKQHLREKTSIMAPHDKTVAQWTYVTLEQSSRKGYMGIRKLKKENAHKGHHFMNTGDLSLAEIIMGFVIYITPSLL